jgi:hypothetical protein
VVDKSFAFTLDGLFCIGVGWIDLQLRWMSCFAFKVDFLLCIYARESFFSEMGGDVTLG